MLNREATVGSLRALLPAIGIVLISGCGNIMPDGTSPSTIIPGDTSPSTIVSSGTTVSDNGDNGAFESAARAFLEDGQLVIYGSIDSESDVDVYDLGPMESGDHVIVNMSSASSLNGAIALFDESGASLLVNDHRNVYMGKTVPFVDVVLRHSTDSCYVVVSCTPGFASTGDYSLVASKTYESVLPDQNPDVILLDFDGSSSVRIHNRPAIDVPYFDAANIDSAFEGLTDQIVEDVVRKVREDYEAYDVTILSTSEGDTYESGMSRVYFGTFDEALLGLSESVDEFNATSSQEAIIFTDTFAAFSVVHPSAEEIAQALANVTSHEIGHLLGLVHTQDTHSIMDVTATLSQLLRDQEFTMSPLYKEVFPIGNQDAVWKLYDTAGGDFDQVMLKASRSYARTREVEHNTGPSARELMFVSSCDLGVYGDHDHCQGHDHCKGHDHD